MGWRKEAGYPAGSSWTLVCSLSSIAVTLTSLAGRLVAPVEGGVLLGVGLLTNLATSNESGGRARLKHLLPIYSLTALV